jgi:hypothetical protein
MQFARIAIVIAALFICFDGTPSFAESCSQMGWQCISQLGLYNQTLSTDDRRIRCAAAADDCKARCRQGFKGFVIPYSRGVEPVDSCK